MKGKWTIITTIIIIFLISAFVVHHYLISIYEVVFKTTPDKLYADTKSDIIITAVPLNALGWKALFRSSEAVYTIIDGQELVEISGENKSEGVLKLKSKDKTGIVKIIAKSPYTLLPSPIDIRIVK